MQLTSVSAFQQLTYVSALDLIRQVINSPFPIALWQMPGTQSVQVLIDLDDREQNWIYEIEPLHESFVINPYAHNHPFKSLALRGDILLEINLSEQKVETQVSPTVSDRQLEHLSLGLNQKRTVSSLQEFLEEDFERSVDQAIDEMKAGRVDKIVLSRFKDISLPDSFDLIETYFKLCQRYPNAFSHLTATNTFGIWMGATPEKLIAITEGRYFSTDALAGTQTLENEDASLNDVAWTQKEIEEQAMVSRYIINCFKKIRLREFEENGPKTIKAGHLAHLKTEYNVDMLQTNSPQLGTTMLELLHPTSAVCGSPIDVAKEFIKSHEKYDRALFCGFLGPVGFQNHTNLFVNLRTMKIEADRARLYAGAGITEHSVATKEKEETSQKMQTLLNVIR